MAYIEERPAERLAEAIGYTRSQAAKARRLGWDDLAKQLEDLAGLPAEVERLRAERDAMDIRAGVNDAHRMDAVVVLRRMLAEVADGNLSEGGFLRTSVWLSGDTISAARAIVDEAPA